MKYVALICARGGSKGLPGKNIMLLDGKPLIAWSIETAKKVKKISRIIVSTDSSKIANVALSYGAEVPFMRPKELAQDDSPEWLVWRHAINYLESQNLNLDAIVVLPATSPLRSAKDVEDCINLFEKSELDVVITVSEASRSPYFNMVSNSNGFSSLVIPPKSRVYRRQDAPEVFDMTTVAYVVDANFLKKNNGIFEGRVKSVLIPKKRAVDIDDLMDFKIAEMLIKNEF